MKDQLALHTPRAGACPSPCFEEWFAELIETINAKRVRFETLRVEWDGLTDRFDAMQPGRGRDAVADQHEALRLRLDALSRELELLMRRANAYHRGLMILRPDDAARH